MSKTTRFRAFKCRMGVHRWVTYLLGLYEHQACRDCPATRLRNGFVEDEL